MKRVFILAIAIAICSISFGQNQLPKYTSSEDKVLKKVKLDMPLEGRRYKNGTGYSLNPRLLKEMPKKVALVSFYSFDPGMTETHSWKTRREDANYIYTTTHVNVEKYNAVGSSGELAAGYYYQSIDRMIDDFKSFGMDLLLPEEYLDTKEKKEYYDNFVVKRAKFNEWIQSLGSGKHDQIFGYIDGYNVIDVVNEVYKNYEKSGGKYITRKKAQVADNQVWVTSKCGKMVESIGADLCEKLEVDAVVVVYFTIYAPKENQIILQNVNMHMFGPNPTPLPEGKKKKFNYFKGKFYCGTRINPEVLIWKFNKKKPETGYITFDGFDVIMHAMIVKMATYLQKGIEKGKK